MLRKPVRCSDAATASSIAIELSSARNCMNRRISSERLARLVAGQDRVGDGDRAGIDEGVARHAALEFELDDRVERAARRLAADAPPQPVADLAERERQREDLRDALDRERRVAVARGRDIAFGVDHDKPERLRIDARQFRNIGRDLAAVRPLPHLVGDLFDDTFKLAHGLCPWNQRGSTGSKNYSAGERASTAAILSRRRRGGADCHVTRWRGEWRLLNGVLNGVLLVPPQ